MPHLAQANPLPPFTAFAVLFAVRRALGGFAIVIVIEESSGIARSLTRVAVVMYPAELQERGISLTILTDFSVSLVWAKEGGVARLNVVAGPILLALCGLRLG
jgi:hypothetical protein